jgi:hypothetical protein
MAEPVSNAAADTLIEQRAPIDEVRRLFKTRRAFAEYLAIAAAARNDLSGVTNICAVCEQNPADKIARYFWRAQFTKGFGFGWTEALMLLVGHIGVSVNYEVVEFQTHHAVCAGCKRQLAIKRLLANLLNFIGLFLLIVAGTVAAMAWSAVVYFHNSRDQKEFWQIAIAGSVLTLLGAICMAPIRKLRVPPPLRYFAVQPFIFAGVKNLPLQT